ncbi:isopeptide-forming domain-containing fimbrial protein [Bifidobacterium panos]|uniref:Gram-positive cocci surface proteins LPxTG domain-containing protein n=1 Tax=Bifidobacterium panos TaxID=2675321 RepID=A0ABX1SYL4_9BIFI|nr:isopeptide-forming domain-containing fimbrial protein [Bifidobacterium sp. DSM 109963]NMN01993.1 hypothetical protein [Bifidobacterium sp. DSM 109963]
MFERRRFRRGCLLPIVVALVAAMICAFGSASTSATAEPEKITLKVTNVEAGVKGTAYKYMDVNLEGGSTEPVEKFGLQVTDVVKRNFEHYIDSEGKPTEQFKGMDADGRNAFSDKLLAVITNQGITLPSEAVVASVVASGDGDGISFHLPMGGYVIKLTNGSSHLYDPIFAYIWPQDGTLTVRKDFDQSALASIGAKSQEITSKKTVGDDDNKTKTHSQIGDIVRFQVKTPIPKYPANATNKYFGVQDHPDPGLSIRLESIKVQIEGEQTAFDKNSKDYSTDSVGADPGDAGGEGFRVEFDTEQYRSKLSEAAMLDKKLIVKYEGKLDEKASIKGGNGTQNHAHPLIVKDNYDPELDLNNKYTNPPDAPAFTTIYTYGVKLTKMDSQTEAELPGTQFELHKNDSKVHVKQKGEGMYIVQEAGPGGITTTITSGKNGLVQIDGLNAGVTYTLKETKSLEDYDPAGPVTIEIKDGDPDEPDGIPDLNSSMIGGNPVTAALEDNRLTYTLTNTKKRPPEEQFDFTLPKTGAMGTAVFSAFGVALVAAGVALVIVRRRKDKQSS